MSLRIKKKPLMADTDTYRKSNSNWVTPENMYISAYFEFNKSAAGKVKGVE